LSDFAAVSDNFGSTLFCGNGCWEIKAYWELDGLGMKKSANPRFGLQVQVLYVRDFRQQEKSRYLSGSIPKQSIAHTITQVVHQQENSSTHKEA
jgi:hypothetical protein